MRRTVTLVASAFVTSVALTACGGGGDQSSPEDTAYAFAEATVDLDTKAMCELMADEDKPLADDSKKLKECDEGLEALLKMGDEEEFDKQVEESKKEFDKVKKDDLKADIDGDSATVKIMDDELDLVLIDDKWYVGSLV